MNLKAMGIILCLKTAHSTWWSSSIIDIKTYPFLNAL